MMGIVESIFLSLIGNGLHRRLEDVLEEHKVKKVINYLEKTASTNTIYRKRDEIYFNALDSYIEKNDIVVRIIEICYDKRNHNFLTKQEFAKKVANSFIKQNERYFIFRNEFVKIFQDIYGTIDMALNSDLSEESRKLSNTIAEGLHKLSTEMKGLHSDIEMERKSPVPLSIETSPDSGHLITLQASPVSNEFSYREDIVEELYKAIKQNRKLALINGLGGIGKTTVAKALYHKVKDEYKHVAWIEYQDNIKNSLLNSFLIFEDIKDATERYSKIVRFLLDAKEDTIIFIDNVSGDDSSGLEFVERLSTNVVLTSRLSNIRNFEVFPIGILSEEQCVEIFYKYYEYDKTREQEKAVRKLVELVKCHTLSVELLARAANIPEYPLEKYAAELKEQGLAYPDLNVETDHTAISQTIAQHLQALFNLVTVNDEQKRILKNFAFMPSIEIPAEVVKWLDCNINDIIGLKKLGWLTGSETGYEMHPIVKEAVLLQYREKQYEDFEAIIDYMSSDNYIKDTDIYTKVHIRLNIAESVMCHFCEFENKEVGLLFNEIAFVYNNQGDYPKALEWVQKALKIFEKVLGLEHPNTATSYHNIASVYFRQGDYTKALEWFQKALEIEEKMLGLEHPNTATSYHSIASVYFRQGDYTKALELYQKALKIFEKVLGLEHPDTATSYNDIASVYDSQGDYTRALELYQKALKIFEKVLGLEHPDTATTYNNIALVYDNQGDYSKALEWVQKALKIREKVLGLEHPDTATSYHNIALVYSRQGDYTKAFEWFQKALEIEEKMLGFEHPDTATSYNNIAFVYSRQGDYPKALELYQKALNIREKVLGFEHPDTIATNEDIAIVRKLLN